MPRGLVILFAFFISVSGVSAELNIDVEEILEFYRINGNVELSHSLEDYVALVRDIILDRISCGNLDNGQNCECLSVKNILKIVKEGFNTTSVEVLNEPSRQFRKRQQLARISVIILNYFLKHETICSNDTILHGYIGDCHIYDECWTKVISQFLNAKNNRTADTDAVEKILRQVKYVYKPLPNRKCVNVEKILDGIEDADQNPLMLPKEVLISMRILRAILYGACIDVEDSASDFLDDIFLHYGENCNRILTMSGFAKLLEDLQMQRPSQHLDHEMNLSFCNKSYARKHLSRTTPIPSNNEGTKYAKDVYETLENASNKKTDVEIVTTKPSTSTNSQDKTLYLREQMSENEKPITTNFEGVDKNQKSSRRTRHTPILREEHEHKNLANECLSPDELVQKFLTNKDVITSSDFLQMCPALVQQAVSGVCKSRTETREPARNLTDENSTVTISSEQSVIRILLAFGAISIITLTSLAGACLIPILNKPFYEHVSSFFLGLAFGTMFGDVMVHIMPQYLGLHVHSDDESEESHEVPKYVLKQLTLAVVVYGIYLLQTAFSGIFGNKENYDGHGHNHFPADIPMQMTSSRSDESMTHKSTDDDDDDIEKQKNKQKNKKMFDSAVVFWDFTTTALIIIAADTIHNFVDGVAISVAFATSEKDGWLASVAVLFHELPHEIADFVVLLSTGLTFKKALFVNFLSGLTSYIGMLIGVFTSDSSREWLLVVTGALFLYVAMGEMLPELKAPVQKKWLMFMVKQIGVAVGLVLMILIAIFENGL